MAPDRELIEQLLLAGENYLAALADLCLRQDGATRNEARTRLIDAYEAVYLATKRRP